MIGRAVVISRLLAGKRIYGSIGGQRALHELQQPSEDDGGDGRSWEDRRRVLFATCAGGAAAAALGIYVLRRRRIAFADASFVMEPPKRPELPTITRKDVSEHGREAPRKWTTFKHGVYDITDFIESHPGGEKILLAAGGSLEPFWSLYAQHKTAQVLGILEELRIGNLDEKDLQATAGSKDANDPFGTDPARHPALVVNSEKPFNAETPPSLLVDSFVTPADLFFVRNHLPVPQIADESKHELRVEVSTGKKKGALILKVDDLKRKFKSVTVTSVVQCAGNRRADMSKFKNVMGLSWRGTAISNAKWTGVRLRDVLIAAGVDPNDDTIKHVHFEGADIDPTGSHYGASIPFHKAMSPEVLIAYEMNGEPLPIDHGYPLRVIVPGVVGARQVKWLTTIRTSTEESPSHWQQKDYRAFSPAYNVGDPVDPASAPAIQEGPVQSAFCVPAPGSSVDADETEIEVAGYAWSGGGRGIIRVEVSTDGGTTWHQTELEQTPDQSLDDMWAWTLWRATIPLPPNKRRHELVCKATDRSYNTQPETPAGIWNMRGLLNNSWHRVTVDVK